MDYIKLAQRTISMLDSMVKSGECHTSRTEEMVSNAMNGLEQLRQSNVSCQREQLLAFAGWLYGNLDKDVERMIVDDYLKGKHYR